MPLLHPRIKAVGLVVLLGLCSAGLYHISYGSIQKRAAVRYVRTLVEATTHNSVVQGYLLRGAASTLLELNIYGNIHRDKQLEIVSAIRLEKENAKWHAWPIQVNFIDHPETQTPQEKQTKEPASYSIP